VAGAENGAAERKDGGSANLWTDVAGSVEAAGALAFFYVGGGCGCRGTEMRTSLRQFGGGLTSSLNAQA